MNNLEKFTAGEVAAENNGTLEQLREVIEHCFQRHKTIIYGTSKYYYLASWDKLNWDCNDTTDLPTIPITQLWEELQALKKPETWWIRVTAENKQALEKWRGHGVFDTSIVGMVRDINGVRKGNATFGDNKADCWDFGNEIDFPTFLKYTGVEVEPKPTNSGGLKNEIVLPEKWGGEIEGLPAPILKRMMECQVEQGNKADHTVFEEKIWAGKEFRGMEWEKTKEGLAFWEQVLENKSYSKFFEMYPETKPEKVEKSLEEKLNEISRLSDLRNDILERNKAFVKEFNEIETQISALLK